MMPLIPHWPQPSHPDIQEVIVSNTAYKTKSVSNISLPPFGTFAKLSFPPCTVAARATYATVQTGRDTHLLLNSDLVYINHSCEPSLIFDMSRNVILAGPRGLETGDELTFFYPSTEWDMAQTFECHCDKPACLGTISGAKHLTSEQLKGVQLNDHIRELLDERSSFNRGTKRPPRPLTVFPVQLTPQTPIVQQTAKHGGFKEPIYLPRMKSRVSKEPCHLIDKPKRICLRHN
ncbi:galactose-proton symport [Hirsutella rhossiliensis]|uniref:Galactose-proton symport n=1 Tax=Hirsutella rhossiliensis TaxID=111463 RepID=A0A9P8MLB1_9HYPO|nr:galactose-proton symport [Hirsutella rhossiliensis]KAH0958378.1 galactose-proton symport [Hirsutella rhossiliensis]